MTAILKHSHKVRAAHGFVNDLDSGVKVYIGLSGTTAWSNEEVPDQAVDTIDENETYWDELFGIAKIKAEDTMLGVPRIDWTSGDTYVAFDTSSISTYETAFYAMGSNNYVYECTQAGGDVASNEPTHTSGSQAYADGYTWVALYDASTYVNNMLTNSWLPVPDNYDMQLKLGAHNVIIRKHIPDTDATAGKIASITYRKIGVIFEPLTLGDTVVDILYGNNSDFDPTFAQQPRDVILALDFITPVARQSAQTETIFSIVEF